MLQRAKWIFKGHSLTSVIEKSFGLRWNKYFKLLPNQSNIADFLDKNLTMNGWKGALKDLKQMAK